MSFSRREKHAPGFQQAVLTRSFIPSSGKHRPDAQSRLGRGMGAGRRGDTVLGLEGPMEGAWGGMRAKQPRKASQRALPPGAQASSPAPTPPAGTLSVTYWIQSSTHTHEREWQHRAACPTQLPQGWKCSISGEGPRATGVAIKLGTRLLSWRSGVLHCI